MQEKKKNIANFVYLWENANMRNSKLTLKDSL